MRTAIDIRIAKIGSRTLLCLWWDIITAIAIRQKEYSKSEKTWALFTLKSIFCYYWGTSMTKDSSYTPLSRSLYPPS